MCQEAVKREHVPKVFDPLLWLGILWSLVLQRSQDLSRAGTQSHPTQRQILHQRICLWPTSPWCLLLYSYFYIIPILHTYIAYVHACMCVGTCMCMQVHEHMYAHVYRGQRLTLSVFLNCFLCYIVMQNVSLSPELMDSAI